MKLLCNARVHQLAQTPNLRALTTIAYFQCCAAIAAIAAISSAEDDIDARGRSCVVEAQSGGRDASLVEFGPRRLPTRYSKKVVKSVYHIAGYCLAISERDKLKGCSRRIAVCRLSGLQKVSRKVQLGSRTREAARDSDSWHERTLVKIRVVNPTRPLSPR